MATRSDWLNKTVTGQIVKYVAVGLAIAALSAFGNYLYVIPSNAEQGKQAYELARQNVSRLDSINTRQANIERRQTALENEVTRIANDTKEDLSDVKRMVEKLLDIELQRNKK